MIAPAQVSARDIRVTGVVQGVGFRPFVHRTAAHLGLAGWVRNVAGQVEIHVEGGPDALRAFEAELSAEKPPLSRIDSLHASDTAATGAAAFQIIESRDADGQRPVPADVALCERCAAELRDPANRHHRHAFVTCTDCGPRYTVIESLPYDRARTSMRVFPLCDACRTEYESPDDRRYHAESIACNDCGPRLWLTRADGAVERDRDAAIRDAAALLTEGKIVAVRGVGGFHLACDATNDEAVRRLRARKHRDDKPFAVMVADLPSARAYATVYPSEARALTSAERPIVLLPVRSGHALAASIAPGIAWVGLMLPSTPLHDLLLEATLRPLVMTSGNRNDEPIAMGNDEAHRRLGDIADAFVFHDREVISRVDDSVMRVVDDAPVLMRRSRGYAPLPLSLPVRAPVPIIAVGPHLKNTFTLASGASAYISPHIGDLEGVESLAHFRATLERYRNLFRIEPHVAVRDLHPWYLSTRIAHEMRLVQTIAVQHHHAHIAAVMAEHGVTDRVVGVALDGTGYGDDNHIWGAEVLVCDLTSYRRKAHLHYAPLPGGDTAAREPWRVAAGYLALDHGADVAFSAAFEGIPDRHRNVALRQTARALNSPLASSMGRLFDAAAAIIGVRRHATYEGQAAMELESLAGSRHADAIVMPIHAENGTLVMDPLPLLVALGERHRHGDDVRDLAACFHESVIAAVVHAARTVAEGAGLGIVALGGGSFQNARLLSGVRSQLEAASLRVLVPRLLGPNDGAISYGQAAVGAALLAR